MKRGRPTSASKMLAVGAAQANKLSFTRRPVSAVTRAPVSDAALPSTHDDDNSINLASNDDAVDDAFHPSPSTTLGLSGMSSNLLTGEDVVDEDFDAPLRKRSRSTDSNNDVSQVAMYLAQPTREVYLTTKPIKIRNVAGNEGMLAGRAGIPVNVRIVDCEPGDCSITPTLDEAGRLVSFDLKVCEFNKVQNSNRTRKIIDKNLGAVVKAEGSACVGFTFVATLDGDSFRFNIPCPHEITMSIETGMLNRSTGYFNGYDFLCQMLRNNIFVNPVKIETAKENRAGYKCVGFMNNGCGKDLKHEERLCQEHKQQEAEYNAREEHRTSSRRSQEKAKALKLEWDYPTLPYATLLLQHQQRFKIFVTQRPINTTGQFPESQSFLEILTQPVHQIIALDTACGMGKWHQPTFPVGNSRRGIDLSMVSFHVIETNMWYYASRRGGDIIRLGIQWRMKQWLGGNGSWMNPASMVSDEVVDELSFVTHLSLLCAKKTTLEYGPSCDTIRINSLLQHYNLPPINFFNLGDGISYSRQQSPANRFIFGPPGIVGTPVADLSHLTYFHPTPPGFNSRMWDIDGRNPSVIQPRLKDVPQTLPPSDPSCDVQRTLNLYFTYRDAYHHV